MKCSVEGAISDLASLKVIVHGRVQGVYFRAFVAERATGLGLTGYVRNLPGGRSVEVQAEGKRKPLEELVSHIKAGPPGAAVEKVVTDWSQYSGQYTEFQIRY